MKGFNRSNHLLSLCGLNCGLCPMHIGNYCPGCGGGAGNQGCKIARCSLEHGSVEYCFQCGDYPCEKYIDIDKFDSFISHKNQKADLEKAKTLGIDTYNREQTEKKDILDTLLAHYNDGRHKTLYSVAVNLLELDDLRKIMRNIEGNISLNDSTSKEKAAHAAKLIEESAKKNNIVLKLRKK